MNNKWTWVLVLILLAGGTVALAKMPDKPGKYDELAMCIKDSGATFYGAFWCPHCQGQKAMFGKSAKLLPYVECSTPDSQGQTPICIEKKITSYPTWELADGTRLATENANGVSLETLASSTGCTLPQ